MKKVIITTVVFFFCIVMVHAQKFAYVDSQYILDNLPEYSVVEINGSDSVYIDRDVLEIFQDFKAKAHNKHIQLVLKDIPAVETIELH